MRERMLTRFRRVVQYPFTHTYIPWSRSISSNVNTPKSRESFSQSELIKPELTDSQRKNLTSCCAIELSFNRVSFAKLRLDPQVPERVLLDAWDSIPLKLPTGKEFKPHLCMAACTPIIPRILKSVLPATTKRDSEDNSSMALVVGTLPLIRSSALIYSGALGYLLGSIHRAISPRPPVFRIPNRARHRQLAAWIPHRSQQDVLVCLDSLLSALPQLYLDSSDLETRLRYAQLLSQSQPDVEHLASVTHERSAVDYNQLLCASVLTDAYLFLTEGVLTA